MQIAFYAPLKPPGGAMSTDHRDAARFLIDALARAGHAVELVSSFRSYDDEGDPDRQVALRDEGVALARRLAAQWRGASRTLRPEMWFTHHVYYKAPDWLGPRVSAELGVPYVIAEASHAPKRAGGRWAIGHDSAADAIRRANLVLCPTRHDVICVEPLVFNRERVVRFPPFLDPAPYRRAAGMREAHRASLAAAHRLDPGVPWIMVAATMRQGDEVASYRALAAALACLNDLPWRLVLAGDGPARTEIETEIDAALPGRACFLGELALGELAPVYAASDVCVWPAINETYGRAMLEAQAAGTAVVSCSLRGVPDSVAEGRTGVHVAPGDTQALARVMRMLLLDPSRCAAMGRAAMGFVGEERSVDAAAARLDRELGRVFGRPGTAPVAAT
ncbi:MAG: glycosyltransferase family 4 protein [Betaproteobacteria bacterium]|nr:glycosyltransferase family 4 protein [Betaproteobacteria bacterium]